MMWRGLLAQATAVWSRLALRYTGAQHEWGIIRHQHGAPVEGQPDRRGSGRGPFGGRTDTTTATWCGNAQARGAATRGNAKWGRCIDDGGAEVIQRRAVG